MPLYRGKFLPDKTIVADGINKNISLVRRERLLHLNGAGIILEQKGEKEKSRPTTKSLRRSTSSPAKSTSKERIES